MEGKDFLSSTMMKLLMVVLLFITVLLIVSTRSDPNQFFLRSFSISSSSCRSISDAQNSTTSLGSTDRLALKSMLEKVVMPDNKTIILTAVNAAWMNPNNSLFDLFLESFRIGNQTAELLNHLMVAAFDQVAYARCLDAKLHCYAVNTTSFDYSGEKSYMTKDYLKMMWRRLEFLIDVLELGFDFVFTDADVMWLRNPLPKLFADGDMQVACDNYLYNSYDRRNPINTGFMYVRSNNKTIRVFKFWYDAAPYFPGRKEQDVVQFIKLNPIIEEVGLKMRFFNTTTISGFCEPSKDFDQVLTMHSTCRIGLQAKIRGLKIVLQDWKNYTTSPRGNRTMSWSFPL